jgi:deoxyadenosine/deoxycytidine kinase
MLPEIITFVPTMQHVPKHIAVVGNIGAGKTTLATKLGRYFSWDVLLEAVEGLNYLASFNCSKQLAYSYK